MFKKHYLSFFLMCVTLFAILISCAVYGGTLERNPEVFAVDIEEIEVMSMAPSSDNGSDKRVKTSGAQYYFHMDWTEDECVNWAENAEILLSVAEEKYGIKKIGSVIIYFFKSDDRFATVPMRTYINMDDAGIIGAFFQHISEQRLPAWLCTGLELYWLDRFGRELLPGNFVIDKKIDVEKWLIEARAKDLPEFGDLWFMPGYVTDELSNHVPSIAYAFVKYMDANGLLDSVVEMYLDKPFLSHKEIMMTEAWCGFFGESEGDAGYERLYYATYGVSIGNKIKTAFITPREYAVYFFNLNGMDTEVNYEAVEDAISTVEESIKYTADWLGYDSDYENKIPVLLYATVRVGSNVSAHTNHLRFQGKLTKGMTIYEILNKNSSTVLEAAHEATHVLTDRIGANTNFPVLYIESTSASYLEEGLCSYISLKYAQNNEYWSSLISSLISGGIFDTKSFHKGAVKEFNDIINDKGMSYFDDMNKLYTYVLKSITNTNNTKCGYIHSYSSATSFVTYLMEVGTKDDFMEFYLDIRKAEEVYGKDIDELISDWLAFLELDLQ